MGDNTLYQVTPPAVIQDDDINQFFTAMTGDFKPRNATSGALEDDQHSLGSPTANWKNTYTNNLFIGGTLFNPDASGGETDQNNAIVSGAVRSTSEMPDFIRASGAGASATILATTTNLQITANGTSVTIDADISVTSLTVAPGSNNTAAVNDANLTDQASSRYTGEAITDPITITSAGTEITSRIGQYACFRTPDTEYFIAYIESATVLNRAYRGYFFDSSGAPIVRDTLANADTLTIMSLGWVFMDSNGTTVDVTYRSPYYSAETPGSPVTDDYWFDLVNRVWKRYDGGTFQEVNRIPIGLVVIDGTNCVASRSFDFTKAYSDRNDIEIKVHSNTQIATKKGNCGISVYSTFQELYAGATIWNITTDLETGFTEGSSTTYYLYVTEDGDLKISEHKYYDRRHDLAGYYHPYNSWRAVGEAFNDGSSNFASANTLQLFPAKFSRYVDFEASGTFLKSQYDIIDNEVYVEVWGAGGGGTNANGFAFAGCSGGFAAGIVDVTSLTSVTVTVGAGGSGQASLNADGATGGTSSFGSSVIATGGEGGEGNATNTDSTTVSDIMDKVLGQQIVGSGTAGDFLAKGSRGNWGNFAVDGGLGLGGWGSNGFGTGATSIVGQGGANLSGSTGRTGFRGLVRVWY